jgi:hypothetical protein
VNTPGETHEASPHIAAARLIHCELYRVRIANEQGGEMEISEIPFNPKAFDGCTSPITRTVFLVRLSTLDLNFVLLKQETPDSPRFRAEIASYSARLMKDVYPNDRAWAFDRINIVLRSLGLLAHGSAPREA